MASDTSEYVGRIDQIDSIELDNEFSERFSVIERPMVSQATDRFVILPTVFAFPD